MDFQVQNSYGSVGVDPFPSYPHGYFNQNKWTSPSYFGCSSCNLRFCSELSYENHLKEHVKCPFPKCHFSAKLKCTEKHIASQHLTYFDSLQIDDETWVADRKKQFPSVDRATIRRAMQEERLKRGERLEPDKRRFAKLKNYPKRKNHHSKDEVVDLKHKIKDRGTYRNRNRLERQPLDDVCEVDLYDSDEDDCKYGIKAFLGTRQFFEDLGETSCFAIKTSKLCETGKNQDVDISDDEWDDHNMNLQSSGKTIANLALDNALGSLIGSYASDSGEEEKLETSSEKLDPNMSSVTSAEAVSDDKVLSSEKVTEVQKSYRKRKRRHGNPRDKSDFRKDNQKKMTACSWRQMKKPRLLQKLLENDIRHERNIILQCVRYVIDQNFFK